MILEVFKTGPVLLLAVLVGQQLLGPKTTLALQGPSTFGPPTALALSFSQAEPWEFAWHVSVYPRAKPNFTGPIESPLCAGAFIGERYILTSAKCVHGLNHSELFIVAGQRDLTEFSDDVESYGIESIEEHPNFDSDKLINNIAIIKTDWLIKSRYASAYVSAIGPIKLPRDTLPYGVTSPKLMRVGVFGYANVEPSSMASSKINPLSDTYRLLNITQWTLNCPESDYSYQYMCGVNVVFHSAKGGDSGAGLFLEIFNGLGYFELIGIQSHQYQGINYFTRISLYLDWINFRIGYDP